MNRADIEVPAGNAGVVYFMCEGAFEPGWDAPDSRTYVKIGTTRGAPSARVIALQTGNPRELRVFRFLRGTPLVEARFHRLLHDYRVRGEWFDLPGPMVAYLNLTWADRAQSLYEGMRDEFTPTELVLEAA